MIRVAAEVVKLPYEVTHCQPKLNSRMVLLMTIQDSKVSPFFEGLIKTQKIGHETLHGCRSSSIYLIELYLTKYVSKLFLCHCNCQAKFRKMLVERLMADLSQKILKQSQSQPCLVKKVCHDKRQVQKIKYNKFIKFKVRKVNNNYVITIIILKFV